MREQNRRLRNQGVCPNYLTTYMRGSLPFVVYRIYALNLINFLSEQRNPMVCRLILPLPRKGSGRVRDVLFIHCQQN
jgi:hypothetical protein